MLFQTFLSDLWSTITILLLNILVLIFFCISKVLTGAYWALVVIVSLCIVVLVPFYIFEWFRLSNHRHHHHSDTQTLCTKSEGDLTAEMLEEMMDSDTHGKPLPNDEDPAFEAIVTFTTTPDQLRFLPIIPSIASAVLFVTTVG
ncbi:hypothetical protein HYFRA_00009205 [Hymenoscyphus fraxineus]|uniref:Uncharacterized protein n=1 Tax=Hymenoscyphus fraxineus TaxID=746836 RepID=A0A9N9KUR2_9HELO|nr:hypothetical protein HYFRA_00009205 [Hymenoscyphus fraxineus]